MKDNKFLIVDGSSILYRAFFALPSMENNKGEHTNAIYGFTNMLMGILEKVKPQYCAIAFDRPTPTFRHEMYEEYKSQRESAPAELVEQIVRVKDLIDAFNIPVFEMDGFEADDIIGSLACLAEKQGIQSFLFSGDSDLFQLISEKTNVLMVRRGISDIKEYDLEELKKRYDLTPSQIIDFKALKGDPSDNIPGIPGIGEKTALKLLYEYGTLEKILDSAHELKGKMRENVINYRDQAILSKELVKIKCDIDSLNLKSDLCHFSGPDYEKVKHIFTELEFNSLMKKIPAAKAANDEENRVISCEVVEVNHISVMEEIARSLKTKNNTLALLIETEETYPSWKAEPKAVAFSTDGSCGYYLSPETLASGKWHELLSALSADGIKINILGSNLKKILNFFIYHRLPPFKPVFDSLLTAYLLEPGASFIKPGTLLKEYLDIDLLSAYPQKIKDEKDREKYARTLAEEASLYHRLYIEMLEKVEESGLNFLYSDIEMPLSEVLALMERRGIKVDKTILSQLSEEIEEKIKKTEKEIFEIAGEEFNLNSPRQMAVVLFEKLNMPTKKKTKTGFSTDVNVLEELAVDYEIADKILYYRQLVKLEGTYLTGLLPYIEEESGKIYTTFNQAVTATGRLSSSDPNLQNIPVRLAEGRRIRKAFIPSEKDYIFLAADYSQIELRILAHLSGDTLLVNAFNDEEDIHRRTAAEIFGIPPEEVTEEMRKKAKAVNFGIIYGISDYGLSRDIKVPRKESRRYIESYFERYSGVKQYMEDILVQTREQGYVKTIFGRRRDVPEINDKNFSRRGFAERTARNTPIQGSAADIIKMAMLQVCEALEEKGSKARLLLQVHDELILEVPEWEKEEVAQLVKEKMEGACELKVPLIVDMSFGNNWFEL